MVRNLLSNIIMSIVVNIIRMSDGFASLFQYELASTFDKVGFQPRHDELLLDTSGADTNTLSSFCILHKSVEQVEHYCRFLFP